MSVKHRMFRLMRLCVQGRVLLCKRSHGPPRSPPVDTHVNQHSDHLFRWVPLTRVALISGCWDYEVLKLDTTHTHTHNHKTSVSPSVHIGPYQSEQQTWKISLKMKPPDIILCVFLLLLVNVQGEDTCQLNTCYCPEDSPIIVCGSHDEANPRFTYLERLFTKELIIAQNQEDLLKTLCAHFPKIQKVTYEGDSCPKLSCVKAFCP